MGYWRNGMYRFTDSDGNDLTLRRLWQDWTGQTNVNKSLEAQQQENEKNRLYNLELAKKQNEWNMAQWERENAYNSPSAQKARLETAGLNADLMYGGSGVMNTASSSPQMTAGAPSSPMDWSSLANLQTPIQAVSDALNSRLMQAQIDNINADTKKKGAETSILSDDAAFRKAYNQGQLDTMYANIRLTGSQVSLNKQTEKHLQSQIQQIDAQVQQIEAATQKLRNDIINDNKRLDIEKLLANAQVKQSYESANLTRNQAERLVNEWQYLVRDYNDKHEISLSQNAKLKVEGDTLKLDADMTYGDRDKDASAYLQVLKFLNQLTTFALPFIKK